MKTIAAIALAILLTTSQALANLRIHNNGSHTVANIYQSPSSFSDWGSDRLSGYLYPGNYWDSPLNDYCTYDVMVVYTDSYTLRWNDLDVCAHDIWLAY